MLVYAGSSANAGNNQCLGIFSDQHVACPTSPLFGGTFGPLPRSGTVANLTAVVGAAPASGKSWTIQVLDGGSDGSGTTVVYSCTVATGATTTSGCGAGGGGATVPAGHFLKVQVTTSSGAANTTWVAMFELQ